MDAKSVAKKYKIPEDVNGTCGLENIQSNKLSFLADLSYLKFVKPGQGLVILTSKILYGRIKNIKGNRYVVVENPHHAFIEYHNALHKDYRPFNTGRENPKAGKGCHIDESARFGKNVSIGSNVSVYPNVVIGGDVSIGDGTIIYSSVSIYDNVKIGKGCIIDAGAVIGGEGFSTTYHKEFGAVRLFNVGGVQIGDNVEIGSNATIDRASFTYTKIMDRAKIDNNVCIGHNCHVGEDTRIAPLSCMGGSCTVGKRVWIGIGCTLKDHIEVGDDCEVLIGSVLINSIGKGTKVAGYYAMPNDSWRAHIKDVYRDYVIK